MIKTSRHLTQVAMVVIGLAVLTASAAADKERDFKNAVKARGCGSIPYSSLQSQCRKEQDQVDKWCKSKASQCTRELTKKQLQERRDNGKQCVAHRKAVAEIYSEAKSKLEDEDDKAIKPLAEKLISVIVENEPGHVTAIRSFENAVKNCEQLLK